MALESETGAHRAIGDTVCDRLTGLAAVLVCHNSWPATATGARALGGSGLAPERIVCVDSGSTDGSARRLRLLLTQSPTLALPNRGFAAAANEGAEHAFADGASAVLFLNPDVLFQVDMPRTLMAAILGTPETTPVALAPRIRPVQAGEPTYAGAWETRLPGHWRQRRADDAESFAEVDFLWATCLLVTREAWRRTGPFDPGYFLYYEDVDWCARARAAGVRLGVVDGVVVWHGGAHTTGGADGAVRRFHLARSAVRFHKHRGAAPWHPRGLWVAGALAAAAVRLGLLGRWAALGAHLRGMLAGARSD